MKVLILYKTKHGSTQQYAEFINKLTIDSHLSAIEDFDILTLPDYDRIIIGSPTYMGNIEAVKFMEENWEVLKTKDIFLFAVGLLPANSPESRKSYQAIPEHIRSKIKFIKVPGRIKMSELNFLERLVLQTQDLDEMNKLNMHAIQSVLSFALGL